jgi:hypothetical protein
MPSFEILPGLPPYGPIAIPFPVSGFGAHQEGFIVQFNCEKSVSWIGNFQPGITGHRGVYEHPDKRRIVVVSGGDIYVIDPETRTVDELGGMVSSVIPIPEKNALLFEQSIYVSLIGYRGDWKSKRLSWDGIRGLSIMGDLAFGEGWCFDDSWHKFSVSLDTGLVEGGAYNGPEER